MRRTTPALLATTTLVALVGAAAPSVADGPEVARALQSYTAQDPVSDTEDREGGPATKKQRQFADITESKVAADNETATLTVGIKTVKVPPAKSSLKVTHSAVIIVDGDSADRMQFLWFPKTGKAKVLNAETNKKVSCAGASVAKDGTATFPMSCLGDASSAQFNFSVLVSNKAGEGLAVDYAPVPNNVTIGEQG